MYSYARGYIFNSLAISNFSKMSPIPEPPQIGTIATPITIPPIPQGIMLAVIKPSWAMFTPVPEPPSMLIFLGSQPEPLNIVLKKYQEFRNDLKAQATKNKISLVETDFGVILAVPKPSLGMFSPIPLPPNMLLFLSPQPEPPDIAFKRYKSYLSILKSWSDSISISIDESITIAEQLGQESQNF